MIRVPRSKRNDYMLYDYWSWVKPTNPGYLYGVEFSLTPENGHTWSHQGSAFTKAACLDAIREFRESIIKG